MTQKAEPKKELSFHQKLVVMQTELKVPKNIWNKFSEFYYRNAEGIIEAAKPYLEKFDLTLTCNDEIRNIGNSNYVVATYTLSDGTNSFSATASAREQETKKGMDSAQITGSTSSYARKYALNALFALDDVKDPDGDKPVKEETVEEEITPIKKRLNWLNTVFSTENGKKQLPNYLESYKVKSLNELSLEQADDLVKTVRANAKPKQ